MRCRWAAAAVLLTWALLHLLAAQRAALPEPAPGSADVVVVAAAVETAGEPCPGEEDPSLRQVAVRSPRTAGRVADGAAVPAPAPTRAVGRDDGDLRRPPAHGRGADGPARSAADLQTFRC
ncbi:exported protein of unknown function [Streptomyces ambofaciens ATCC 23877]|uniref:Secreted protein n=1 Tax=Streptomyces ambofaciens (strain ATCC 23877 / 3486 / DSM 40053 / JCM 4204 / NBRC 12836 / NRRL B-2516) TaxID=278992 RepID=A0A0K2B4R0_STRA7|nr:exported protein of unknown function [Streptomyces ambofaciens ATCC 23877]